MMHMIFGGNPGSSKKGGVLFIDEAYSLQGEIAITTLLREMENHREDVIVIFAGYPEPMQGFLDRNLGMRSRIAFQVKFEDYYSQNFPAGRNA